MYVISYHLQEHNMKYVPWKFLPIVFDVVICPFLSRATCSVCCNKKYLSCNSWCFYLVLCVSYNGFAHNTVYCTCLFIDLSRALLEKVIPQRKRILCRRTFTSFVAQNMFVTPFATAAPFDSSVS